MRILLIKVLHPSIGKPLIDDGRDVRLLDAELAARRKSIPSR
jgi:hypothetical protein